jgi:hypothetical protein
VGAETSCVARLGEQASEGRAHLETDELLFRGDFRLRIPYKEMTAVRVGEGWLQITWPGGEAGFQLGAQAEKWAVRILNRPSLLDKLGVKPGHAVSVLGIHDPTFLAELGQRASEVAEGKIQPGSDLIFLGAESLEELDRLSGIQAWLKPAGGVWVVAPKGQRHIREADVLSKGLEAGLVDVKAARFSQTHTAHKFVIRLRDRR